MVLTFLGTGTSQGVPVIGCRCPVCTSTDSKDKRLRTSAMIETSGKRFIIDAGPDFRMQMLREGVDSITAILLTHFHKDHIGGIDDVRALNYVNYPQRIQNIDIYAKKDTIECVRKDYDYAFSNVRYRGVPLISLHEIPSSSFTIEGVEIIPIQGTHSIFSVTGFRIGPIAYLTDFKSIAETEVEKLKGVSTLVVNALRFSSHDSHFSVSEALELISRVSPQKAYLTHMSHEIGTHTWASERLPENVYFAYDTLKVFNYF
ncbi:MAG: MBL fold metallo-hydrolase [Alistipes sp.]|nr:MBL fold metallo-hydrolase [Candidatus Alistipes equi]